MDAGRRRNVLVLATAAACIAAAAGPLTGASPPDPQETRLRIVATIQALDSETQTVWLITGTGFALRILKTEVAPSCQIKVSGAPGRLVELKAGDVVRVECLVDAGRLLAVVIETVSIPAQTRVP